MVWASQATSRCQGDTGTSEFVGSDGRTTAQVTWENVPAAPAGARGQRDAPGWQGTSEQWAPVGAGRGGEGRGGHVRRVLPPHNSPGGAPPAGWTRLAGWTAAPHQRGSPAPGASPGTSHRGAGPALRPVAAWTTRPGWGHPPGLHLGLAAWFARAEHATQSRQQAANGSPSHQQAQRESCPQAFLPHEYNTPPGTGVREPGRRAPPRPAVRLGTAGSWTGRGPAALLLGWPADASAASETVAWLRAVGGLFRTQHSAEADSRATSREERRLSGLGVPP